MATIRGDAHCKVNTDDSSDEFGKSNPCCGVLVEISQGSGGGTAR